jgi:phosphoribosylaminoimidazolecarboxamide formyltransferase/IMP cyclohydrolase
LKQRGGKELSFNNLLDLEGALLAVDPVGAEVACAIVKHTTPCGLATGATALEAYQKALSCDPVSAFGSVIAFTVPVDEVTADRVSSLFVECIVAPEFSTAAVEILGRKKNLRVLEGRASWGMNSLDYKRVRGGVLVHERASTTIEVSEWTVVTTPSDVEEYTTCWFAVSSRPVKSNAIVPVREGATIGLAPGKCPGGCSISAGRRNWR